MHGQSIFYATLLGYILAGRLVIKYLRGGSRDFIFALLNLAGMYFFFFHPTDHAEATSIHVPSYLPTYLVYLGLVIFFHITLRLFAEKPGKLPWIAFFSPLLALALIRYLPVSIYSNPHFPYGPFFIGISYLTFRVSYLAIEIRNRTVPVPGFFRYMGYSFFVPIITVGPINPYHQYVLGFESIPPIIPVGSSCVRLLVGAVKYKFLGSFFFQLTYTNLLQDDHYHPWVDLPVAMVFYYLFLYCNFSGFCDMAIGAAGLMGIPVVENFNNPLLARNMREFWNRWHITLSQYMRDVVFAPLSKFLIRVAGPSHTDHAIVLTIVVVFLLIGVWHGVGWNYALFGAAQALGVVTAHYYTLFLKKRLGRDGFKAYNENRWIHALAVVVTFCYYAATLFLFANTVPQMKAIFSVLR